MDETPPSSIYGSFQYSRSTSTRSRRHSISSIDSRKSDDWVAYLPPDASSPEIFDIDCRLLRYRLFPVEILLLLGNFLFAFFTGVYRVYFFQHIAHQSLQHAGLLDWDTVDLNGSFCYNQTYITDLTNASFFQHVQNRVNNVNMVTSILYLGLSGVASLVLGPISDIIGRKPILACTVLGIALTSIFQLVIIYFGMTPYLYMLPAALFGAFGGHATLIGVTFASVNDVTQSKKWLTLRMGSLQAALTVSLAFSSLAVNNWIHSNGCDFRPLAWLMFALVILFAFYYVLFPEPLNWREEERSLQRNKCRQAFDGFKCFIWPPYVGYENWWRVCTATAVILLEILTVIGGNEILNYFLHNEPLEWDYSRIGFYGGITAAARGVCLLVILPLLIVLKFPNTLICLAASLFAVVTNIMTATVKASWEMYLAGIFEGVSFLSFPAVRSILAQLVPSKDAGAVFSIVASMQMIASIGSSVLFNEVYHPQAEIEGQEVNAGVVFWIIAGFWAIAIPLVLLLMCCRPHGSLRHPEKIGLLDDDNISGRSLNTSIQ